MCVVVIYSFLFGKEDANDDIYTTLKTAAKNCDLKAMESLVKKNRDALSINKKVLYYAAKKESLEAVKFLLDEGVDINTSLALLGAADSGQLEVVKLFLERGANLYVRGWKEQTPRAMAFKRLFYNSGKPYEEIIDLLAEAEKQYKSEQ